MSLKNNRILGTLVMLIVVSIVTVGLMTCDTVSVLANTTSSGKNIHELERNQRDAQSEQQKLKSSMQNAAAQANSYEAEIAQLDSEIAVLTKQIALIDSLCEEWTKDKEANEKEMAELEARKQDEIEVFEAMLRMSYQYGTDTYFHLIFGSQNIGDFLSRADLIGYHLKANDNVLASLSGTINELEEVTAQYEESISAIESYGEQQKELQAQLEERSEYALQRKLEFEADEAKYKAQMDAKNAELWQMQAEILQYYEEQRKNGNVTTYSGGPFFLPLPPGSYRISSEFTNRISPITGRPENHNGLDMAAPGGTSIYAAESGIVIVSTYSNSWGNVIQIDHGGGIVTLYAHCSYRGVEKGQTVAKGQEIARVGTTGWSTGNHLHFTVYKNGVAVNPRQYLSGV